MGSLSALISRLSVTTDRIIQGMATDSFFVLRAVKTTVKGETTKTFLPTTTTALPCFYSLVTTADSQLDAIRASRRTAVILYRFTVQAVTDVKVSDRLQLVARAPVGQKEMEILRVADPVGLTREVIALEEAPA